jgi:hypothetical protein
LLSVVPTTRLLAVPLTLLVAAGAAGCGGGSSAVSTASTARARLGLSATQVACLRKHGLDFAARARPGSGSRRAPGRAPLHRRALTAKQRRAFAQRRRRADAAFQACGIRRPGFGRPPASSSTSSRQ